MLLLFCCMFDPKTFFFILLLSCSLNGFLGYTIYTLPPPLLFTAPTNSVAGPGRSVTHDTRWGFIDVEANTSALCSPPVLCFVSWIPLLIWSQRTSHGNFLRQNVLISMSCNMSQRFLWLLKEMWMCILNIHRTWSVWVCTLPCGHVFSSVACG